jgi:hypothetical protein
MGTNWSRFNKYHNTKLEMDGMTFDSKKEFERWCELKLLAKAGAITELRRQVSFEVVPKGRKDDGTIERAVKYIADFVYRENGKLQVEDVKGFKTPEYIIKRKLMLEKYGITVREI